MSFVNCVGLNMLQIVYCVVAVTDVDYIALKWFSLFENI